MKIEVQANELFACVGDLKSILDAPNVECATIDAKSDGTEKGHIVLRGVYCDRMVELKVYGCVVKPGVAGVRFDRLEQACCAFLRHGVTVSSDASYLRIECGRDRVTLKTTVTHEHLPAPSDAAPRAVFESGDFLAVMSDVQHAQCDDFACRRSLCGIQFEVGTDMQLRAIATDGLRLAASARQIRRVELPSASFGVFLPHTTMQRPPRSGVVFCGNMTDLFGEWTDEDYFDWRVEFIKRTLGYSHKATYLWLTKRVEAMCDALNSGRVFLKGEDDCDFPFRDCEMRNQYFGFTAENQEWYDKRIAGMIHWPEWANAWVSCEPLLGPIDLDAMAKPKYKWLVVGCESGPNRRPCKIEWVESIVEQCLAAKVPVFVKQLDLNGKCERDIDKFPAHLRIRQVPWA